jgi:uncharacterized protein YecT (DUF1311 family)
MEKRAKGHDLAVKKAFKRFEAARKVNSAAFEEQQRTELVMKKAFRAYIAARDGESKAARLFRSMQS